MLTQRQTLMSIHVINRFVEGHNNFPFSSLTVSVWGGVGFTVRFGVPVISRVNAVLGTLHPTDTLTFGIPQGQLTFFLVGSQINLR